MSRIGNLPIPVPGEVTIEIKAGLVTVKSSKGELSEKIDTRITVKQEGETIVLTRSDETKESKSLHGLSRSLIANMIEGLTKGYSKELEIQGVGYRANLSGKKLTLSLGFSHPIEYTAPDGVDIEIDKENKNLLKISGISKQKVGQTAAEIRSYKKPEPYKGKGIRYVGEHIIRKAGKAAAKAE